MTDPKTYIGDGVYAEFDQWGDLHLTAGENNRIVLEPRDWQTLTELVKAFWTRQRRESIERTAGQDESDG